MEENIEEKSVVQYKAELSKRFFELQRECRKIGRNDAADVKSYKYEYVNLPKLRDAIGELFEKYDFFFSQPLRTTDDGKNILQTIICDAKTGLEFLHSEMTLYPRNENNSQDWGGAITYMRRYQLLSVLGIVADKDDDDYLSEEEIKNRIEECESITELNNLFQGIRKNQRKDLRQQFAYRKKEIQENLTEEEVSLLKEVKIK